MAALLHDIGHSPFSHGTEELFPEMSENKKYSHEDYTVAIIKNKYTDLFKNDKLNKQRYNITVNEIIDLISKKPMEINENSLIWKIIISSQLDADRSDYLLRDSIHCGIKYGIYDLDRLLNVLTLVKCIENPNGIKLGIRKDGLCVAESVIIARYQLFTQVYFHKTRRAYDLMLIEALRELYKEYPPPDEIDKFLSFDDCKAWTDIYNNKSNKWSKLIIERKHLKMINESEDTNITKDKIDKLTSRDIEHFIDTPQRNWYDNSKVDDEIFLIDSNGLMSPLSLKSTIVKSITQESQDKENYLKRIYVHNDDYEEAIKIM